MRHARLVAASFAAVVLSALASGCGGGGASTPAPAPTCTDGLKNGQETGVDCGGPACPACADGLTCATGADCRSGACGPGGTCLASQGVACGAAGACASGHCVDGVCCESACAGTCESCAQAGRAGFCDAAPVGTDPDAECAVSPATCGTTGTCSGARTCQLASAGTPCTSAGCSGAILTLADTCDGSGACASQGTQDCSPFACDPQALACRSACAQDADCAAGFACAADHLCRAAAGQACGIGSECASGFCTDGVCCESACGGTCEACNQAGREGFCDAVAAGADPANECADQGAASCGTSGACSGSRSCALYQSGTTCAAAACAGNVSHVASTCSGAGVCQAGATQNCFPYLCNAVSGGCFSSCTTAAQCQSGFDCAGGACRKIAGQACLIGSECASGFCTDGVCCNSACNGLCQACSGALTGGPSGTCASIPDGQDPQSECSAGAGVCNGAGACR